MSSLYNLEPQPTASCILHTTSGDISLELWAQQVPLTCRNFLQHCLDGYYDNTIFHRLVPGFILQGGDPTGTGNGGESIYDGGAFDEPREEGGIWPQEDRRGKNAGSHGVGFKDEFHSRLKFNRRGLLGMANEGPDTNGSQFFLTLGDTPELQGKNTLFGRVVGDTIYNLAKMSEMEVENERPIYTIRITSAEVVVNPFKDMVARKRVAVPTSKPKEAPKAKKRKGGKQLLSFGDEVGDDEAAPVLKKTKFDTRIVVDLDEQDTAQKRVPKSEKKAEKVIKRPISRSPSPEPSVQANKIPNRAAKIERVSLSPSPEPQIKKVSSLLEQTNAQIAELKASMKRNITTAPVEEKKKSALEQMIPENSIRGRKRRPGAQASSASDAQALEILNAFRSKLDSAPKEKPVSATTPAEASNGHSDTNGNAEDDEEASLCDLHFIANCQSCKSWDAHLAEGEVEAEDDNDISWMSHALSFTADKLGKDLSYRKKAEEELVVIDPRAKERTLKEEKRAEREARSGAGTGREWDRVRNEKLARQSAMAGRGAR
jgi:peptidyl-prolyl cis-trans isomerase SDCCAG10